MKFFPIVVVFLICFVPGVQAQTDQSLKLKSLTVGSGEGPITSGISVVTRFAPEDESRLLEVMIQADVAWVNYGPKYKAGPVSGLVAATAGHIFGVPWVGPLFTASVPVGKAKLSTIQWPAVKGWKPENYEGRMRRLGYFGGVSLDVGQLTASYHINKYMSDPWNHLPGLSYAVKIRKDVSILPSITWNSNKSKPMFYIGLTWTPQY